MGDVPVTILIIAIPARKGLPNLGLQCLLVDAPALDAFSKPGIPASSYPVVLVAGGSST
jgi:hypothetical protein